MENNKGYRKFPQLKNKVFQGIQVSPLNSDFDKNKQLNNNNIIEKQINFKNYKNINNNKQNIHDDNVNNIINNMKVNEEFEHLENSSSSNIYEKNIAILNDKIKEQENNINYLNERLKNYDSTMDEMAKLNIELNRLNEIIKDKNNTIQEYREISEISKKKFEELIQNKKELLQKIKILEKENYELKNRLKLKNDLNMSESNQMKLDLDDIEQENQELKRLLQEKNDEIKQMNDIIEKAYFNSDRYKSNTPYMRNYDYNINLRNENIFKTEPSNFNNMYNSYSTFRIDKAINKYNYLKNKYSMEPLKYSNYLLDNLQSNIRNNYLNLK